MDVSVTYGGWYLYALDVSSGSGTETAIRKIDTRDGSVETFVTESEVPALRSPTSIQVDKRNRIWVSVSISAGERGILRFDPEDPEHPEMVMSGLCCTYGGTSYLGDAFKVSDEYLYYAHAAPDDGAGHRFNTLYRIPVGDLPASGDDGEDLVAPGEIVRSKIQDIEYDSEGRLLVAWKSSWWFSGYYTGLWRLNDSGGFDPVDRLEPERIAFARRSPTMYRFCFWGCDDGGRYQLLRRDDYGASGEDRIVGSTSGSEDGSPGKMDAPVGLALSPDGTVAWIADQGNRRIRKVELPEDPNRVDEAARNTVDASDDPVQVASGNFAHAETDLVVTGDGGLSLGRAYNSIRSDGGVFGRGWSSTVDARLDYSQVDASVVVRLADGQEVRFLEGSGGGWVGPSNRRLQLSRDPGSDLGAGDDRWTLTRPDGSTGVFDADGRLVSMGSPGRPATTVTWSGGVPAAVMGPAGMVSFTDDTAYTVSGAVSGSDGLVDRAVTSTGLEVDYLYRVDDSDSFREQGGGTRLVAVSKPHRVGQASGTYGWTLYELTGGFVSEVSVTTAAGSGAPSGWPAHTLVANTYDALGRVVHQVTEDGDDVTFDYGKRPAPPAGLVDAAGFTTVTNAASGDQTVYQYGPDGSSVAVTDALGHAKASVWAKDQPDTLTSRSGVATSYTFDAADRPVTQTETVGGTSRTVATYAYVTGASSPGARTDLRLASSTDAAGVTTTYTYSGAARDPDTVSVPCDPASLGAGLSCPSGGRSTTTYTYFTGDKAGLVKDVTDPDGVKTSFTYRADRSLASTTVYEDDGTSRATTVDVLHPGDGGWPFSDPLIAEATRTETPSGAVSWEGRDAQGQVRESRDPLYDGTTHKATRTTYRLDGTVASVTDPADHTTSFEVHRTGDAGWAEAPSIAEVRISTDADGVSSINKTDRSGDTVISQTGKVSMPGELATTTNAYGELGRLLTSTGPTGVVTSYHYDTEGRVTGTTTGPNPTDAAHTATTVYDGRGQVLSEMTPMGTDPDGAAVQRKVACTYDTAGRKTSQLEGADGPSGGQLLTGYSYDATGRPWRTIEHRHNFTDAANATVIHTGDRVSETRYTVGGRTAQTLGPPVDVTSFDWSGADSTKSVTTFGYDDAGRQVSVTAPDGGVTATAYDPDGHTASVTAPGGYTTSYLYDTAGHQTGVVTPSGLTGPGDPATVTATTGYDAGGQVVTETDPHIPAPGVTDASTRTTTYTPGGRVATVTDALGHTVTYGYDSRGNRTSRTALNDAGNPVTESWTWNKADQELTHTVPPPRTGAAAMTTTSTYDTDFGWLTTVTDPTSRVQAHTRYHDGTLKTTTYSHLSDPVVVNRFWINGRGWRTKSTSTTGTAAANVWSSTYDRAGHKLTETSPLGTISHTWGLAGEQLTLGYHDGTTSSYLHDPAGRLTEVSVTSGGITVPYTSYSYDTAGRQSTELIHAAGGAARHWSYDGAGRLTTFTETLPNTTTGWETYTATLTYRPDGRVATESVNSEPTITYSYDTAGQLTSAVDGTGGVADRTWTYGTRGNRLTSTTNGVTTTYTTNPNGTVAKTTTGTHTVTYSYDDAARRWGELHQNAGTDEASTLNGFTTEGHPTTIKVIRPGEATTTDYRTYNPDGLQTTTNTIVAGGTSIPRTYQWDTTQPVPQIVEARNSGSMWFRTTWGNQRTAYTSGTATPQWYQYDARGSVIRTDPTNTAVATGPERYDPFGGQQHSTGVDRTGYRGELTASNLIYLRNRNYDPTTGQFTTPDPLDGVDGTPTLANPHHYTDNDPLNKQDPTGLRPNDGDLKDACAASTASWAIGHFENLDVFERVEVAGFIPDRTSHLDPTGKIGMYQGDGRDFALGAISEDQSRFFMEIDFPMGVARIRVNPTHSVDGTCWSAWPITVNNIDYGLPGGDQNKNMLSFSVDEGGRGFKVKWSVVHGDRRWFAPAMRPAFDGTLTFKNEGDSQAVSYDGDCFPSVEAYRFGSDGWITSLALIRSRGPMYGLAYAPNCYLTTTGSF